MKITFCSSTSEVITEIGRRVKETRLAVPLTQQDLAKLTNLSQRTISSH